MAQARTLQKSELKQLIDMTAADIRSVSATSPSLASSIAFLNHVSIST